MNKNLKNRNRRSTKLLVICLFITTQLLGQNLEIARLSDAGLKMSFPAIYFKHNSINYAAMPYTVDNCLKYIALHFNKEIKTLLIWRDNSESEKLTKKRIKRLTSDLRKFIPSGKIKIQSMKNRQKISKETIGATTDNAAVEYLIGLNSVFEISKTRIIQDKKTKHWPHLVWTGWKHGFHWSTPG